VATGAPGACLEWSTARALAPGATDEEIADTLVAVAPVAGLGRVGEPAGLLRVSAHSAASQSSVHARPIRCDLTGPRMTRVLPLDLRYSHFPAAIIA